MDLKGHHKSMSSLPETAKLTQAGNPIGWRGKISTYLMNVGHQKMALWALNQLKIGKDWKILDIGCGGGKMVKNLLRRAPEGVVVGIDPSDASVQVAKTTNKKEIREGKVKILKSGVSSMPFEDGDFNLVMACDSCYFWPDLIRDFGEVNRILNHNGLFCILNMLYDHPDFESRNQRWAKRMKLNYLKSDEYNRFLKKVGFRSEFIKNEKKNWIFIKNSKS